MQFSEILCRDGICEIGKPTAKVRSANCLEPAIIGLYGLPGSGKSFLLAELGRNIFDFTCYNGIKVITAVTLGGLEVFQSMKEDEKIEYRERAMAKLK
jgi:DNA replication protein DnaC